MSKDWSYQALKSHLVSTVDLSSTELSQVSEAFSRLYFEFQTEAVQELRLEPVTDTCFTWVRSSWSDDSKVLLFFHGGGYTMGSTRDHLELIAGLILETRIAVLSVDYRLCPEHVFPAALDDVEAAYRWLLQKGYHPEQIGFAGISAGALLVTQLILNCTQKNLPQPKLALVLSGPGDLDFNVSSCQYNLDRDWVSASRLQNIKNYYLPPNIDRHFSLLSPMTVQYLSYPTTLFQAGDYELLLDYSIQFYQKLRQLHFDVYLDVVSGLPHCWQFFAKVYSPGRVALQHARSFLEKHF